MEVRDDLDADVDVDVASLVGAIVGAIVDGEDDDDATSLGVALDELAGIDGDIDVVVDLGDIDA